MMKWKRRFSVVIVLLLVVGLIQISLKQVQAASIEESQASVSVIAQYSQGTKAIVYLKVQVSENNVSDYGVVVNGTRYAQTGNVIDGSYIVCLDNLEADTAYTVYPYVGKQTAETGITFTTAAATSGNSNLSGYYGTNAAGISYCIKNPNETIDIQGAGNIATTYANSGWSLHNSNGNVQVYAVPAVVSGKSGNQYVRLTYIVRNNTVSAISDYQFGISCDSMIGNNDNASVYTTPYGMRVAESEAENALSFAVITKTSNAADGLGNMVDTVSSQWYGEYSERAANVYHTGSEDVLVDTDSGMTLSWQDISLEPGQVKTFSVIFGIADDDVLSKVYEQLSAPEVIGQTYNSVTVYTEAGQTYNIRNSAGVIEKYEAQTDGEYTFEGLTGGTDYEIYTEKAPEDNIVYVTSDYVKVTTEQTPALKNEIENTGVFRTVVQEQIDLVALLSKKIEGLEGSTVITAAEFVNPSDSQYLSLLDNGSAIVGDKLTPDGYKVLIKITAMTVNSGEKSSDGITMNDVVMKIRVTESDEPSLRQNDCDVILNATPYCGLKSVKYSYTGAEKVPYTTWYSFTTYGKSTEILKSVNGASGYKSLKGTVTQESPNEDGEIVYTSNLNQKVITLPKPGYYTFILVDQNGKEYIQYIYLDAATWAMGKPLIAQEQNLITLVNNDSGLYKVNYIYTGDTEYTYSTWYGFLSKGKENTNVNTTTGYRLIKGNNTGTTESEIDGQNLRLTMPGWYTFLMTYDNGKQIAYTAYISVEDAQTMLPVLTQGDDINNVTAWDNKSNLKKVIYQYSGDDGVYEYTTWYSFVKNGKLYTDVNGSQGYKSVLGTIDNGISSLDGKTFHFDRPGWYTFLMYYMSDGEEKICARKVYIGEKYDTSINAEGFLICYEDTLTTGTYSEYSYQYAAMDEPEISADTFKADKTVKSGAERTQEGGKLEFTVCQSGWYIVQVKDSVLGTKYYKIQVIEPEAIITPDAVKDFPYLYINGVNIHAICTEKEVAYIRVGTSGEFTEGAAISVSETGVYTIQVIDNDGILYALTANVSTLSTGEIVETENLEAAITAAQNVYKNSGYIVVENVQEQTEVGTYISTEDYMAFAAAIQSAQDTLAKKESQKALDNATTALKSATKAYSAAARKVVVQLVKVEGSVITIEPATQDSALTAVYYNTEDGVLTPVVVGTWSQMIYHDKTKVTTFDENGSFVLKDVPNGIYTFLIKVKENGAVKEYYQYAVVANNSNGIDVAKQRLTDDYYLQLTEWMNTLKKESEANEGDCYISNTLYSKMVAAYNKATVYLNKEDYAEEDVQDVFIPFLVKLHSLTVSIKNGITTMETVTPEEPIPVEAVQVVVENAEDSRTANVTLTSADIKNIYIAYGECKSWASIVSAGYEKKLPSSGVVSYTARRNGLYTAMINYTDGSCEYQYFTVENLIYPFTVTDVNGILSITFEDLSSVAAISYGYGEEYTAYSNEGLLYYDTETFHGIQVNDTTLEVSSMGNGVHTVFVKMTNGLVYTVQPEVTFCTKPAVIQYQGRFAAYANGFRMKSVAYAKGVYTDWNTMYPEANYFALNSWIDYSTFEPGTYTFYFCDYDGKEYFETVEIE